MSRFTTALGNITETITYFLSRYPRLRDNDNSLIANVWNLEMQKKGLPIGNALKYLAEGKLTNSETIRRCRQRLQEMNPELRGKNYVERLKDGKETKKHIYSVI